MHAFIIEDDYLISQSLQDMLGDLGFTEFSFARSEDAAVSGAAGQQFDLITADVRLLPGNGLNAVDKICRKRNMPVVIITGYPDEARERIKREMPRAVLIGKPIKEGELAAAVRQALGAGTETA